MGFNAEDAKDAEDKDEARIGTDERGWTKQGCCLSSFRSQSLCVLRVLCVEKIPRD